MTCQNKENGATPNATCSPKGGKNTSLGKKDKQSSGKKKSPISPKPFRGEANESASLRKAMLGEPVKPL